LTRSYYPYDKGGEPLMRAGAVKYLKDKMGFVSPQEVWKNYFKR